MDAVITYCNTDDPWKKSQREWNQRVNRAVTCMDAIGSYRFYSTWNEVVYCVRGIRRNAGWIRKIFFVTNSMPSPKLMGQIQGVIVVLHADIYPDPTHLPTFNSNSIESHLHRISGLSEVFLVFNDDFFITAPVTPECFIRNNVIQVYVSQDKTHTGTAITADCAYCAMWKNANRLLDAIHGHRTRYYLSHVPYVVRKSTIQAIWDRFPNELNLTSATKFRSIFDVNAVCALSPYIELEQGRAVLSTIAVTTVSTVTQYPEIKAHVSHVLATRPKFLCLQSSVTDIHHQTTVHIQRMLDALLPSDATQIEPDWWEMSNEQALVLIGVCFVICLVFYRLFLTS